MGLQHKQWKFIADRRWVIRRFSFMSSCLRKKRYHFAIICRFYWW